MGNSRIHHYNRDKPAHPPGNLLFHVYSYYNAPEFHPFTRACLNFPNIYHFPTVSIKYCHLVLKYCVFQYVCIVSNVAFFINI